MIKIQNIKIIILIILINLNLKNKIYLFKIKKFIINKFNKMIMKIINMHNKVLMIFKINKIKIIVNNM